MPRKKMVEGHKTNRDIAFSLTKEPLPRKTAAKVLRTHVVLNFGLENSGLDVTAFGREFLETDLTKNGEKEPSKLIFKWLAGDNAATRKKFEKAGREIPGLLELFDWPGFGLLEDEPISQQVIDSILSMYSSDLLGAHAWTMPGATIGNPKTATWYHVVGRRNTERLVHWKNLDGFLIILGLVRESEMSENVHEHLNVIFDLYRALPTVASMPGFRSCKDLLYYVIERIHLRCPLSRMMTHVMWDAINVVSSMEIQRKMATAIDSDRLWREFTDSKYDVVTFRKITPQELRNNPLNPDDINELYHRSLFLDGSRTKTLTMGNISEMGLAIDKLVKRGRE